MQIRELTEAEKQSYDEMSEGAKQINLFGDEEELDAKDFVIERTDSGE
ncbi:hypothetical protein [Butyrivibrio sp. INlla16]|nr:hypothetical protein [Butyrivibrio sp. INlla16]SDB68045.1 hypothetical protein SAMN02910263_04076 [Butyrivibrio sp. INlla16]